METLKIIAIVTIGIIACIAAVFIIAAVFVKFQNKKPDDKKKRNIWKVLLGLVVGVALVLAAIWLWSYFSTPATPMVSVSSVGAGSTWWQSVKSYATENPVVISGILVLLFLPALLFTENGRKALYAMLAVILVVFVIDCNNRSVQAQVRAGLNNKETTKHVPMTVTQEALPSPTPVVAVKQVKPERIPIPVTVDSEKWTRVPRPDNKSYGVQWCESPRPGMLVCVVSDRQPTEQDQVIEIEPNEDLSSLPHGSTLWVTTYRTKDGDPDQWEAKFYYTEDL